MLHYGQLLQNCTIRSVWDELKASCDFVEARKAVSGFNNNNRWRKRGIAMVPTKFGISFTTKFMNQVSSIPSQSPPVHPESSSCALLNGVCLTRFFVILDISCLGIPYTRHAARYSN